MWIIISHYKKDVDLLEYITERDRNAIISVDESLFKHDNVEQIWVYGLINHQIRTIILDIIYNFSGYLFLYNFIKLYYSIFFMM